MRSPIIRTEGSGRSAASQPRCRPFQFWRQRPAGFRETRRAAAKAGGGTHGPSDRRCRLDASAFRGPAHPRLSRNCGSRIPHAVPGVPARHAWRATRQRRHGLADAARATAASALASAGGRGWRPSAGSTPLSRAAELRRSIRRRSCGRAGKLAVLARPAVAIVGSRAATPYALEVARAAGRRARRARHRRRQRAGSRAWTRQLIGAVSTAADPRSRCSAPASTTSIPPSTTSLAENVASNGVVVSELGPGAMPLPEHFPLRNRIISGISLAVVVVEASEKSGSLITARAPWSRGATSWRCPAAS